MLTTAPSLGSHSRCSFHYHGLHKDPSRSKYNPKGCVTLEQAAAQGHTTGSSPACFPQHRLLPGRLITPALGKDMTDNLQSKLTEPPLSWLHSQLISHHTRCHSARTQATHPVPGPQHLPSPAQQKDESSWAWSKCRDNWESEFGSSQAKLRQLQGSTGISKSHLCPSWQPWEGQRYHTGSSAPSCLPGLVIPSNSQCPEGSCMASRSSPGARMKMKPLLQPRPQLQAKQT